MLSSARLFETSESQLDHDRLMSLINSLSEGFLAVSQAGLIEMSNGVALSLLDANSLVGKKLAEAMPLVDPKDQAVDPISLLAGNTNNISSRDYRLRYDNGTTISLYLNISVVRAGYKANSKGGFVVLFRDITKERTAEEERDEFISVASHELRNPVAIIEGSLSNAILLGEKSNLASNLIGVLKSAQEQAVFLENLINDLSMVSRADTGKLRDSAAEFDLKELIDSIFNDYRSKAEKKGLQMAVNITDTTKINGSRLYTREILQNLITNAIKYTQQGQISISVNRKAETVEIGVSDTGFGISKEEQSKLFNKFFRSQDSRVRQSSGTGLGLYVSAKLAKLIGGRIIVSSEINKGSSFVLAIPTSIT